MDNQGNSKRRYDLDRLRIVGIGAAFLFHCFSIFAGYPWFITNKETSTTTEFILYFFILWMMPLLFIISGRAMYYSLQIRGVSKFLKNRFYRLMIPFIFGVFILSPIIIYIQRISKGTYMGTFFEFFSKDYYQGFYGFGGNFAWMGLHLWYLLFLFIFTFIAILPARYFLKKRNKPIFGDLTRFLQKPGAIFLLSVPIILTIIVSNLEPIILGRTATGGWSFISYSVFFSYGFIFAYDSRYDKIINRHWKISVVLAAILITIYFWIIADKQFFSEVNPIIMSVIVGLSSFSILLALFGLFHLKMQNKSIILGKLTEGVLPFYILHLPIIVIVGFFITRLNYGVFLKLIMIIIISFSLTISIYYLLIKRINFLRLLFGMKLKN